MPDARQLPFLLKLLDDDSPVVREAVVEQLRSYGPALSGMLDELDPDPAQRRKVRELLSGTAVPAGSEESGEKAEGELVARADLMLGLSAEAARDWLVSQWEQLGRVTKDLPRLERGLSLISGFIRESAQTQELAQALDALALEFENSAHPRTALGLAEFLFTDLELQGVDASSYYSPENSDILHVLESRRGNPISLCCIYILIGYRTGLKIFGCNLPRHFMARIETGDKVLLVDCYNGGKVLRTDQLDAETARILEQEYLAASPSAEVILGRVLRNLNVAFSMEGREDLANLMLQLERNQLG
jgi:regulator of sirC expression with transglutaminase-like and TPR domain